MAEAINSRSVGDNFYKITNDRNEGWRVVIERADGTSDYRSVSGMEEARQVMSLIDAGQFYVEPALVIEGPLCRECGEPFERTTHNQVYCELHKRSR